MYADSRFPKTAAAIGGGITSAVLIITIIITVIAILLFRFVHCSEVY